ncbi:hypothetical protein C8R45DRAFT_88402 [Mycena sanguinolenta]|nr:hypothetical protein C8R45DRAFT_88402 [Mycena sanguinolenta]
MTNLSVILGAVIVAAIFSALFFGAASVQTYNYYHTYRSDPAVLKGAVGVLWTTNALHFTVYTYTVCYYVVDALESAWVPQVMNWSFKLSVWLAVALVLLLDIFYTFWIYKPLNQSLPHAPPPRAHRARCRRRKHHRPRPGRAHNHLHALHQHLRHLRIGAHLPLLRPLLCQSDGDRGRDGVVFVFWGGWGERQGHGQEAG